MSFRPGNQLTFITTTTEKVVCNPPAPGSKRNIVHVSMLNFSVVSTVFSLWRGVTFVTSFIITSKTPVVLSLSHYTKLIVLDPTESLWCKIDQNQNCEVTVHYGDDWEERTNPE